METKVNYALVGGFVLLLGAVLIGGVLWLASGGAFQKKYDRYLAVEEESVAGLNLNAPVKYNGVDVGKVEDIRLDTSNPARVNLLFAIERGTPIKVDTVAMLKTQGITGIVYVELSGGAPNAPLLRAAAGARYPVIDTRPSLSARLENVLTNVLAKLDSTSNSINALLSEENRAAFQSVLKNTAQASAHMEAVVERIGRSASAVERMGNAVAKTSASATKTVDAVGSDVKHFSTQTLPELERLLGELNDLTISLRRLSEQTERDPRGLLFGRKPVPAGPGETEAKP
ncbi:MAG: mammalian cell entry protein [Burkholderiales bacterium RIFCSPLOWO2_12_FULL_61_40]|nr:MAG: mammalian cell entry protein [Burkholderiales bacterium RIFCSPLOWO2_12_FULL_61_40]